MIQTLAPPANQILLVEDESLIRMMAAEMFDILGFSVLEAASGGEAVAIAADPGNAIGALMIDLGLPDQPGEQVIRTILGMRPGLPVIISTGADAVAARHRLGDCGPLSYLEKPYSFKDLERVMAPLAAVG